MSRTIPARVPSSDGVVVALHDLGGPELSGAPLIVMCHATGFHGRVWEPVAEVLSDRFRCVAPDFRGHGTTQVTDRTPYAWTGVVDDLMAVVDAVGERPVAAVGWSLGGGAIVGAELRRPGTIAAAFLYEPIIASATTAAAMYEDENPLADTARRRRAVFDSRDDAFGRYRSRPPFDQVDPAALRAYVEHGFADQADGTVRLRCAPDVEATLFEEWRSGLFDDLSAVDTPITIGVGHEVTPAATMAANAAAELPRSRPLRFADLSHFGPLENPVRIAEAIVAAVDPQGARL